ncbi:MAG: HIT family protein [Chloroflexi bacterium]|nr:HIT family protein [Chloroflexota bacterium]
MRGCVFCDIVAGNTPAYTVYDDDLTTAFLDHAPLRPGHVLVLPKTHWPTLADLPRDSVGAFFEVVQRLSKAVEQAFRADGSFVALNVKVSQSVPHLHAHVVPRHKGDGLFGRNFQWIRRPYPDAAAMREAQHAVRAALSGAG